MQVERFYTAKNTPFWPTRSSCTQERKNFDLVKLDYDFHPAEHIFWVNACWRSLCFLLWKRKSKFKPDTTDCCFSILGRRRTSNTVLQNSSPRTWVKPLLGTGWICFWKVTRQFSSKLLLRVRRHCIFIWGEQIKETSSNLSTEL